MPTPQGLSGAAAIALVASYANEPNLPTPAQTLIFLNRGLEEITRRIGGIRLWAPYPTVVNQATVTLNDDVLDVVSVNFSAGQALGSNTGSASPFARGVSVYQITLLEQQQFMDIAAGFPNTGFGPPQFGFVYQDQGTAPGTTLPVPPAPQLSLVTGTSPGTTVEVGLTYVNTNGETTLSAVADLALTAAQQARVSSPPGVSNATGYNAYAGPVGGPYHLQNASPIALGSPFTLPGTLLTVTLPPSSNTAIGAGTGGALLLQLYPAATIGQLNIYYHARPQLWADTTTSSWTNLDTSAQEAAVIFAVGRVLAARGRINEWKQAWQPEYESMIESLLESIQKRTIPRSGQVRDVMARGYPGLPWGW